MLWNFVLALFISLMKNLGFLEEEPRPAPEVYYYKPKYFWASMLLDTLWVFFLIVLWRGFDWSAMGMSDNVLLVLFSFAFVLLMFTTTPIMKKVAGFFGEAIEESVEEELKRKKKKARF
jgi:hypothetical protein